MPKTRVAITVTALLVCRVKLVCALSLVDGQLCTKSSAVQVDTPCAVACIPRIVESIVPLVKGDL